LKFNIEFWNLNDSSFSSTLDIGYQAVQFSMCLNAFTPKYGKKISYQIFNSMCIFKQHYWIVFCVLEWGINISTYFSKSKSNYLRLLPFLQFSNVHLQLFEFFFKRNLEENWFWSTKNGTNVSFYVGLKCRMVCLDIP